jgi:hypothetical protein
MLAMNTILNGMIRIANKASGNTIEITNQSMRAGVRPRALRDSKIRHLQSALTSVFVDYAWRMARCCSRRNKQLDTCHEMLQLMD